MFIPVEQRPATPVPHVLLAETSAPAADSAARNIDLPGEAPEVEEELLIEEVSIDGMCGVY